MCRSQSEGGRRCRGAGSGGGGGSSAAPTGSRSPGVDVEDEATIRARRSDAFNRMFPGPLTEAQRRFFSLRDSGYQGEGAIDQDGHAVAGDLLKGPAV